MVIILVFSTIVNIPTTNYNKIEDNFLKGMAKYDFIRTFLQDVKGKGSIHV